MILLDRMPQKSLQSEALPGFEPGFREIHIKIPSDNHYTIAPLKKCYSGLLMRYTRDFVFLDPSTVNDIFLLQTEENLA